MSAHTIPIGATAEHDAALRALKSLVQKISPDEAANAFLYSLSTRALEYRAVLGSYWYAAAIPEHTPTDTWHCYECGWSREKTSGFGKNPAEVLRTLSMLRTSEGKSSHKLLLSALTDFHTRNGQPDFGCVHTSLHQCLLVLDHFLSLPPVRHTEQDEELLQQILQCIYALEPHQRGRALQKKITQSRIIKSNAWEIDNLLNAREFAAFCLQTEPLAMQRNSAMSTSVRLKRILSFYIRSTGGVPVMESTRNDMKLFLESLFMGRFPSCKSRHMEISV